MSPVINSRSTWSNDSEKLRRNKGPLVSVRHPDGHYSKMYQADAAAQGLIEPPKRAPTPENKLATGDDNKSSPATLEALPVVTDIEAPAATQDDFTTISGVGKATARLLAAQGITTFAQLRSVELESLSLSRTAQQAIESWRNGG